MNHIKSLAGQTAVYGISSILGRLINYLLVPLYTLEVMFSPHQLGQVADLYAFSAFFLILYTHGMETTFFRFSAKIDSTSAYNQAFTSVLVVSTLVTILLFSASDGLATMAQFSGDSRFIRWMAMIIFLDAITALPFAKMRQENKARKFVILKLSSILINFSLQIVFLLGASGLVSWLPDVLNQGPVIDYIFIANLAANLLLMLFLWKYFRNIRFQFNWEFFRPMLVYSIPILITGLAGTINEQLDKILIKRLISADELGIYHQVFKLAVLMQLAVQAFRYAGEPFFFSRAEDKNAPKLFADVLHYFVIFGLLLFTAISFNLDLIGKLMLSNPIFRAGLFVVPVIMVGKLLNGVYINISIWFKIKDKTIYGTYFTIFGSIITIAGNIILIPILGYMGSAVTIVLAYLSMVVVCYFFGQKYFPVPYRFLPMIAYLFLACGLVWISFQFQHSNFYIDSGINMFATLIVVLLVWLIEKGKLVNKTQ